MYACTHREDSSFFSSALLLNVSPLPLAETREPNLELHRNSYCMNVYKCVLENIKLFNNLTENNDHYTFEECIAFVANILSKPTTHPPERRFICNTWMSTRELVQPH